MPRIEQNLEERIKAIHTLRRLSNLGITRNSLSKYCLVVYPPRNALSQSYRLDQKSITNAIATLPENFDLDLYVHVPFCSRACTFCNFYFSPGLLDLQKKLEQFVEQLEKETKILGTLLEGKARICSLYFGGGSPSLLSPEQVKKIVEAISLSIGGLTNTEVTIELHPEVLRFQSPDYLEKLREVGITRISIGLQSTKQEILQKTARGHSTEEATRLMELTKKHGFIRNVDLMWGFYNQTLEDHKKTLEKVIAAEPDSITTYFLEIRPTSPEYQRYVDLSNDTRHQTKIIELGLLNREILEENGFEEKTFDYWFKGQDFEHRKRKWSGKGSVLLTIGPGTYNWIITGNANNILFFKPYDTKTWSDSVDQGEYLAERHAILNEEETKRRNCMFALRKGSISASRISQLDGLETIAHSLVKFGLMQENKDGYVLTLPGKLLNHEIASIFSSDAILNESNNKLTPEELKYSCATRPDFIKRFKQTLISN